MSDPTSIHVEVIARTDGVVEYHAWCTCSRHISSTDPDRVRDKMRLHLRHATGEHADLIARRQAEERSAIADELDGFTL